MNSILIELEATLDYRSTKCISWIEMTMSYSLGDRKIGLLNKRPAVIFHLSLIYLFLTLSIPFAHFAVVAPTGNNREQ